MEEKSGEKKKVSKAEGGGGVAGHVNTHPLMGRGTHAHSLTLSFFSLLQTPARLAVWRRSSLGLARTVFFYDCRATICMRVLVVLGDGRRDVFFFFSFLLGFLPSMVHAMWSSPLF